MMSSDQPRLLRVGIIGAGEVAQVIHLPVLTLLSHLYTTTAICDISKKNAEHCASKFQIPLATTAPSEVWNSPNVDVVFNLTSDEFHETYTIAALHAGKHVMVEKPMTLSLPSAQRIAEAEAKSGRKVFVGYMRRYAASFRTFKREIASIPRILYARSRDFSGPNAKFVSESGTFPVKHTDDISTGAGEERALRLDGLFAEAFSAQASTPEAVKYWRFLGSLGSHDLSLMRETLGFPDSVEAVSVNDPFYTAMMNYRNPTGEPFAVTYESGIDGVPDFDAHLAVYGEKKRVMIKYDSPYVKGLPIKVTVQETNEEGEIQTREILGSYEDAYTAQFKELYNCLVHETPIKTSSKDALEDLKLFDMMFTRWRVQCST